jgi:hypothetical protein
MRVIARYGRHGIELGDMPILPEPEDRVRIVVPPELRQDNDVEYLTVGRRIFEERSAVLSVGTPDFPDEHVPASWVEWVCVLTFLESR